MKPVLLAAACIALPFPALAQTTPSPKLPPANPLPYDDSEAAAVLAPINATLAAISRRDGAAMAALGLPDARITVSVEKPDGTRMLRSKSWVEFTAGVKPGPERLEEKIGMPAVEIDGDIAMVWAPFTFTIDGKLSHCGVNHFSMARENGAWKIASLAWSERKTGCPAL